MVITYEAGLLYRNSLRITLVELKMSNDVKDFQETKGMLVSYFAVDASETVHRALQNAIRKFLN